MNELSEFEEDVRQKLAAAVKLAEEAGWRLHPGLWGAKEVFIPVANATKIKMTLHGITGQKRCCPLAAMFLDEPLFEGRRYLRSLVAEPIASAFWGRWLSVSGVMAPASTSG